MASTIKTNNITGFSGGAGAAPITLSGDTATLSGTGVSFPSGHVIETKQYVYRGTTSLNYNSGYYQPPNFEVQTNALVANAKFLINYQVSIGTSTANDFNLVAGIFIDDATNPIQNADNAGHYSDEGGGKTSQSKGSMHNTGYWNISSSSQYLMFPNFGQYMYASSLSVDDSITFKIKVKQGDASNQTIYVNYTGNDTNDTWITRSASQITVQQIVP